MNIETELIKLHNDLAELYRGNSTDQLQIARLWLRIEQLEAIEESQDSSAVDGEL